MIARDATPIAHTPPLRRVDLSARRGGPINVDAYCYEVTGLKCGPFVKASTYPARSWDYRYDVGEAFGRDDPNRPVVMRGARRCIVMKYSAKSHYAYEIARRYLARAKINIVTPEGAEHVREKVCAHFARRDIYVHDFDRVWPSPSVGRKDYWGTTIVFLDGKPKLIPHANLHGVQSRLRKSGKLSEQDLIPIMKRMADLCFRRRERELRRLEALTRSFKWLLKSPHDKRSERAAQLIGART